VGEKIKFPEKTEIRVEKGQRKNFNLGWHKDRKEKPIRAPSIHVGAVVGAGSLWQWAGCSKVLLTSGDLGSS
jgi:hypothetical protein